jgi:hypothetical protein
MRLARDCKKAIPRQADLAFCGNKKGPKDRLQVGEIELFPNRGSTKIAGCYFCARPEAEPEGQGQEPAAIPPPEPFKKMAALITNKFTFKDANAAKAEGREERGRTR